MPTPRRRAKQSHTWTAVSSTARPSKSSCPTLHCAPAPAVPAPARVRPVLPHAHALAAAPSPAPVPHPVRAPHPLEETAVTASNRASTNLTAGPHPLAAGRRHLPHRATRTAVTRARALGRGPPSAVDPTGLAHAGGRPATSGEAQATEEVAPGATLWPRVGHVRVRSRLVLAPARAVVRTTLLPATLVAEAALALPAEAGGATVVTISATVDPGRPGTKMLSYMLCYAPVLR